MADKLHDPLLREILEPQPAEDKKPKKKAKAAEHEPTADDDMDSVVSDNRDDTIVNQTVGESEESEDSDSEVENEDEDEDEDAGAGRMVDEEIRAEQEGEQRVERADEKRAVVKRAIQRVVCTAEMQIGKLVRTGKDRDAMMDAISAEANTATDLIIQSLGNAKQGCDLPEDLVRKMKDAKLTSVKRLGRLLELGEKAIAFLDELCVIVGKKDDVEAVKQRLYAFNSIARSLDCDESNAADKCLELKVEYNKLETKLANLSISQNLSDGDGDFSTSLVDVSPRTGKSAKKSSRVKKDTEPTPFQRTCFSASQNESTESRPTARTNSTTRRTRRRGGVDVSTIRNINNETIDDDQLLQQQNCLGQIAVNTTAENSMHNDNSSALFELLRTSALPPLGQFSGKGQSWSTFVDAFLLRYPAHVWSDKQRRDMLSEALRGVARSHYEAIPSEEKDSFNRMVRSMKERLGGNSVAVRLRSLEQWSSLSKTEGQSVTDFCLEVERVSAKAHPELETSADLSFLRAQKLFSQLRRWDRGNQLATAIEETSEERVYDEVKKVALRLERNRDDFNSSHRRHQEPKESTATTKTSSTARTHETDGRTSAGKGNCGNCGKRGHVAKDCWKGKPGSQGFRGHQQQPPRMDVPPPPVFPNVPNAQPFQPRNNFGQQQSSFQQNQGGGNQQGFQQARSFSTRIIDQASCNEIRSPRPASMEELLGARMESPVEVLQISTPALIDTGSQLSIISCGTIAKAIRQGVDVDSMVEELPYEERVRVTDASGGVMSFFGVIRINVRLVETKKTAPICMYVSKSNEDMVLLGTNSMDQLGVRLLMEADEEREEAPVQVQQVQGMCSSTRAVVEKRAVIGVGCSKEVVIHCSSNDTDRILYPVKDIITTGLFRIDAEGNARVPVVNNTGESLTLTRGEDIGEWSTDNWKSVSIHEAVEMMDQHIPKLDMQSEERVVDLKSRLAKKRSSGTLTEDLIKIVEEFPDVFALHDCELTRTDLVQHDIETGDQSPIRQKCRPVPMGAKKKVKEMLEDLVKRDIIERSSAEWSSPIVLVEKKDKSLRLCIDYRALNKTIKQDCYPLPDIDKILQTMGGKRYFSTLDMHSGYWQIALSDAAKEKSAFITSEGLFQFKVLPFGLSTSPATFQRLMDAVLKDLRGEEVFVYIDDIMICTETEERHYEVLRAVLETLRKAKLCLKAEKCSLMETRVPFLGHVVDQDGIHADPEKVKAIKEFPQPTCISDIRTFLGMCSYYRKFILRFSSIAKPLNELTSPKVRWEWTTERNSAFNTLKEKLCQTPVLVQPDVEAAQTGTRPYIIYTDACKTGVGAVLCQEGKDKFLHPISFASKRLSNAESRYHVTDLEGLAIIYALNKYHYFVYGMKVIVRTDHQPLTSLFKRSTNSGRVMRWAMEIQRYDVEIEYVKGTANVVADALSRGIIVERPDLSDIAAVGSKVVCATTVEETWKQELAEDVDYKEVFAALEQGNLEKEIKLPGQQRKMMVKEFTTSNDNLLWTSEHGVIHRVVPRSKRKALVEEAHSGVFAAHFGEKKIFKKLQKHLYWPGMKRDIANWIKECKKCFVANAKAPNTPPLKPLTSTKPYEIVGLDLLELGGTTTGNKYALVLVDSFTKWGAAYPIPDKSAKTVAKTVVERWICEGGRWPKQFHSDQGTEFVNKFFDELTKLTKMSWTTTKGYNPRENGMTERFNGTLVNALKKSTTNPAEWDQLLPYVVFAYNTSPHEATGESPFFLLHGFDPELVSHIAEPPLPSLEWVDKEDYRTELVEGLRLAREVALEHLDKERRYMKEYYDKNKSVDACRQPQVGDRVYMRAPQRSTSDNPKLDITTSGPYRVLETSDNSALITSLSGKDGAMRIQFDLLLLVPSHFDNTELVAQQRRGKRGRPKKREARVMSTTVNVHRSRPATPSTEGRPSRPITPSTEGRPSRPVTPEAVKYAEKDSETRAAAGRKKTEGQPTASACASRSVSGKWDYRLQPPPPPPNKPAKMIEEKAGSKLDYGYPEVLMKKIHPSDAAHPGYCCKQEKILMLGTKQRTTCRLASLSLGEVLPNVPEGVKKMKVASVAVMAHACSVLLDRGIPSHDKERLIWNTKRDSVSVEGLAVAWSAARANCSHIMAVLEEDREEMMFEDMPFSMEKEDIMKAWRKSERLNWTTEGVKYIREERDGYLILAPEDFYKMNDCLRFEDGRTQTYRGVEDVLKALNGEVHKMVILITPSYIPEKMSQFLAVGWQRKLEETGGKMLIAPPPATEGKHEELRARLWLAMKELESDTKKRGRNQRVQLLCRKQGEEDMISDPWRCLGMDPKERRRNNYTNHQIFIYMRQLSIMATPKGGFPLFYKREQLEKKAEEKKVVERAPVGANQLEIHRRYNEDKSSFTVRRNLEPRLEPHERDTTKKEREPYRKERSRSRETRSKEGNANQQKWPRRRERSVSRERLDNSSSRTYNKYTPNKKPRF